MRMLRMGVCGHQVVFGLVLRVLGQMGIKDKLEELFCLFGTLRAIVPLFVCLAHCFTKWLVCV